MPTREAIIQDIKDRHPHDLQAQIREWSQTDLTGRISPEEWAAAHESDECQTCHAGPARLYANGWQCVAHAPNGVRE